MGEQRYTNEVVPRYTRLRVAFKTTRGDVQWFVTQLEYNVSENTALHSDWKTVARFDHNPASVNGHDIREEGLHMDICDPDGTKRRSYDFPDVEVNQAPAWCEQYLIENHEALTKRYAKLAGIKQWNRPNRR